MQVDSLDTPVMNQAIEEIDEFLVVERTFSPDAERPSVGLANMHSVVGDIELNKDKIVRAIKVFKERHANIVIFPEFCMSGYFWEDEAACRAYMDKAVIDEHTDWVEREIRPLLDDDLRAVVLNALSRGENDRYFNKTMVIGVDNDYRSSKSSYLKVFLPGIEKLYTDTGKDNRLVLGSPFGRVGFTTCYDYLFTELLRKYSFEDEVDVIVEVASWRAFATRDYAAMNIRSDYYYGQLWDMVMSASSAMNQVWTVACNAVGRHEISGIAFWGGSGVWAPSGLNLIHASHFNEELIIVHNLDLKGQRKVETDDFSYAFDFSEVYHAILGQRKHSYVE
jgi:predicted amidohydrolase